MAGSKTYTSKKGTPGIGSVSRMKAGLDSRPEQEQESEGLPANTMSRVGEIEAKHGVLGSKDQGVDVEDREASDAALKKRVSVKRLFGDVPEEYRDQVDTFIKRNGQDVAATEENYGKLARLTDKMLQDGRRSGVALEDSRHGLGKDTLWDAATRQKLAAAAEPSEEGAEAPDEDVAESDEDAVPARGIGGTSAMRSDEEIDADYERVFGKNRRERFEEAVKAAGEEGTSIWSKLRQRFLWETDDEANKRRADARNKQAGDFNGDFDWNDYTAEMNNIDEIERSNIGLNAADKAGTMGVKIGNSILGFLHDGARLILGKSGEYDTPDDVYLNSDAREKMHKSLDQKKGFFSNLTDKKFQYDFEHINREDAEGNVVVYDADNTDFPNAYPDEAAEFANRMADAGLSVEASIDIGAYTPEGNRDLYWQGRELLLAMSDFDPSLLSNLKSVRITTKEQFAKAMGQDSPNHDVYNEEFLDDRPSAFVDGHLIIFLDKTSETDETKLSGRLHPPPEELRNIYHQALAEVVMGGATPEFRKEWEKVSLLQKNEDGKFVADPKNLNTIIDAFSGVADVEKQIDPEIKKYWEDVFTYGFDSKDQEMAAAIEMYKNARLPEILFKLRHDSPEAYAYLTRMLAVVDRFEEQLMRGQEKARAPRPKTPVKPAAKMVSREEAARLAQEVDALARAARELGEKGVTPPVAPQAPKAPSPVDLDWQDDDEVPPEPPPVPEKPEPVPAKPVPVRPKPAVPKPPASPQDNIKPGGAAKRPKKVPSDAAKFNTPVSSLAGFGGKAAEKLAQSGINTVGDLITATARGDKVAKQALGSPKTAAGQSRRVILWQMVQRERSLTPEKAAQVLGFAYSGTGNDVVLDWIAIDREWSKKS